MNVDHTKKLLSFLSLCTGYGGIEIGVERSLAPATLKPVALVEIEAFAVANLVAKMEKGILDPAPIWTDLKTLHAYALRGLIDILMAGYPCQPFSTAGQRQGKEDPRHLWPWIKDSIEAFLPSVCFFENVPGHVSLGLREVLTDLVNLGYRVDNDEKEPTVGIFSAEECGAPHRRERLFIMAYRERSERWQVIRETIKQNWHDRGWEETPGWVGTCCQELADTNCSGITSDGNNGRMGRESKPLTELADTQIPGLQKCRDRGPLSEKEKTAIIGLTRGGCQWPARPGQLQHEWEEPRILADTQDPNRRPRKEGTKGQQRQRWGRFTNQSQGQVECQLGGTAYGAAGRVDSTANRVDRLRLCGNGVYPDTVEIAFTTLMNKIINPNPAYVQPSVQLELFA